MSSKKISKMVDTDVDKALANIGANAPKLDMKADDTLKAAVAPTKAPSFGEAFKAARAKALDGGPKTFTWGGKSYSTKMAGEGAKRPQLARSSTGSSTPTRTPTATATPPKSDVSARTKEFFKGLSMKPKAETPTASTPKAAPAARKTPVNAGRSEGFLSRFGKSDTGKSFKERQEQKYGKPSGRAVLLTGKEAREANKRQGTIGGYAKGGKIDGCAIRGKTRAMKKGK
jgi:hypothetical protein